MKLKYKIDKKGETEEKKKETYNIWITDFVNIRKFFQEKKTVGGFINLPLPIPEILLSNEDDFIFDNRKLYYPNVLL